jgi:hypothetical protein
VSARLPTIDPTLYESMTQPLPELTRHVDLQAIAAQLNRRLQPEGIKVAVVYQVNRLQIALEGLDTPERDRLSQIIWQTLRSLRVPVKTIELSGYRTGESAAVWQQQLRLSDGQRVTSGSMAAVLPAVRPTPDQPPAGTAAVALPVIDDRRSAVSDRWHGQSESAIILAAQRGDIAAIHAFVQSVLAPYGMTAQTQLQQGVVQLTIVSAAYLGGPAFAGEIAAALLPLDSDLVREVAIYKCKFVGATPFLIQQLALAPVVDDCPVSIDRPLACPIGIKLIAGLYLVVGLLHLGIAIAMAGMLFVFATAVQRQPNVSIMFPYLGSTLCFAIAVAAFAGVVAIGLWQRQRWGLLLSYLLAGLMIFRGGDLLFGIWGTSTWLIPLEIGLLVAIGVMLWYLTRPLVTRQFR